MYDGFIHSDGFKTLNGRNLINAWRRVYSPDLRFAGSPYSEL